MPCKNCNNGTVTIEDSNGGIINGHFEESHRCIDCGATGRIEGEASNPPNTWQKTGRVFNAV